MLSVTGKKTVGIVGVGKVGTAMAVLLTRMGYELVFISSTNEEKLAHAEREVQVEREAKGIDAGPAVLMDPVSHSPMVDILLVTTSDRAINSVARDLAGRGGVQEGQIVAHMSGSMTSRELEPVRKHGALAASLHPLQSFADVSQAIKNIPGSVFCLEGDEGTKPELSKIIEVLGGVKLEIPAEHKPLYHAGAVVASNYLVSLVWVSLMMYEAIGLDKTAAIDALMPLIEGTLKNIRALGAPEALTGPIARGDWKTVVDHLEVMRRKMPHLVDFYRVMGTLTVQAAGENKSTTDELLERVLQALMDDDIES
jgi:predicted short-subunit dehydrogenase-like oxidoreductase (DUF2520 family)